MTAVALLSLMIGLGALSSVDDGSVSCWLLLLASSSVPCDDIGVVSKSYSTIGGSEVKRTCFEVRRLMVPSGSRML